MTRARDLAKLIAGSSTLGGTGELVLKDVDTADGSSPKITFQTGDTDIAADDVLGTIDFQAPDEGTGTDALLVAAGIEAVSEGDFSASSNATKLSFKTGASETATEKMTINSLGNVGIGTASIDVSTQAGGSGYKALQIESDEGGQLNFDHNDAGTGSTLGQINFQRAGEVVAEIEGVTDGATDNGRLSFRTQPDSGALTERMRIDHDGKVGIGTTDPLRQLSLANSGDAEMSFISGTSSNASLLFGDGLTGTDVYRGYIQYQHTDDKMLFATAAVARLTIDSATNTFGFDFTSASPYGGRFMANGSHSHQEGIYLADHSNNLKWKANMDGSSNQVGASNATAHNATSDYRLKENIEDLTDGITKVKQLQPRKFNWISDETDTLEDGFIAHEVATAVPSVVKGSKDGVVVWQEGEVLPDGVSLGDNKLDDDGNTIPEYQGIEYGKLTVVLTKALQEAIAKIEALETKVAALEAE